MKLFRLKRRGNRLVITCSKQVRTRFNFNTTFKDPVLSSPPPPIRRSIIRPIKPPTSGSSTQPSPVSAPQFKVLNRYNHDPAKQLNLKELITRIVALAQVLSEKRFYPYQIELTFRLVESMLNHDGQVITCLMARQMGKSECIGSIAASIAIILPRLAREYPDSWHLNITDDSGVYRGYADGVKIGIYAPKQDQSSILFERVKKALTSDTAKKVLQELRISFEVSNGSSAKLSNGSRVLCETASKQAKIEGETHHLLILEESQEIDDVKIRKSLHPMVAATMGTIVKIGTATTYKCDFYSSIQINKRMELGGAARNHFFFPYQVGVKYNSLYRDYISQEKTRLGEDSDEFQTSYCGNWIFERGMFVTQEQLFHRKLAMVNTQWSFRYDSGMLPLWLRKYSLVAGIDWGSTNDSTVVTLMAVDWDNPIESGTHFDDDNPVNYVFYQKHVVGWLEFVGDNYEYQFGNIMEFLLGFPNLRKVVTDSNTCGKPIYDRLEAAFRGHRVEVVPFNFQPRIKSDGYKQLYADICGHRITFPANEEVRKTREYRKFIEQLLDLKKEYKGNVMYVAHPEEKGCHDDYCFPAGSPVLTRKGEKPIETVIVGDEVLTSKGWRKVTASGQTGTSALCRVGNLVATPNHPVWCENKNMYVRLDSLMLSDTVKVCAFKRSSKWLTGCDLSDDLSLTDDSSENTIGHTLNGNKRQSPFTDTFGKNIKESSLKGMWSIIKTVIAKITHLATSASYQEQSTRGNTPASQSESNVPEKVSSLLNRRLSDQAGTRLQQDVNSPLSVPAPNGQVTTIESAFAQNAEANTLPEVFESPSLVPLTVQHVVGDARTLKLYEDTKGKKVPVYNLTVEDSHEFVCQGVLVHNCDSFMMANYGAATKSIGNRIDTFAHNPFI